MADIFISYSQKDRTIAEQLAKGLADRGYSVWYDVEISPGMQFRDAIMRELAIAKAAIVIWSQNSVASRYVQDETEAAVAAGKLIATRLADLNMSSIPFGFRSFHTDLVTDEHRIIAALRGLGIEPYQPSVPRSPATNGSTIAPMDSDAIEKLQEIEHWKEIRQSTDPQKFRAFLKQFQKGSFRSHAHERLAELEWHRLAQNPTNRQSSWFSPSTQKGLASTRDEKALESFILEFEHTKEAGPAKAQLAVLVKEREENEWTRINKSSDPEEFDRFLSAFSRGGRESEAIQIRDTIVRNQQEEEAEWRQVASSPDLERIKKFRKKFPEGKYKQAAADREEEVAWNQIKDGIDEAKLKEFQGKWPKGRFAGAAATRLADVSQSTKDAAQTAKESTVVSILKFVIVWGAIGFGLILVFGN